MATNEIDDFFGEILYSYSREQALVDGILIDILEEASKFGFKIPVAVTDSVWRSYLEWSEEDTLRQKVKQSSCVRVKNLLMRLRAVQLEITKTLISSCLKPY